MIEHTTPRQCNHDLAEHEILFSFNDDSGAYAFGDWWLTEGEASFHAWAEAEGRS